MPRKARFEMPGDIHHVMARGLHGETIFKLTTDKTWLLNKFIEIIKSTRCRCYAWVLMDTHYHFLLRPSVVSLSVIMRKLNTAYARYYNHTHNRRGYVFQDRYKSIPTRDLVYFKELVCYIHLNPIRGGLVNKISELDSFTWSGHAGLLGTKIQSWLSIEETLFHFGPTITKGQKTYLDYIISINNQKDKKSFNAWNELSTSPLMTDTSSSGNKSESDPEFVRKTIKSHHDRLQKQTELIKAGWDLERLVQYVMSLLKISQEEILSKTKKEEVVAARSLICHWAIDKLGLRAISVARYFGHSSSTTIRSAEKGRILAENNNYKITQ